MRHRTAISILVVLLGFRVSSRAAEPLACNVKALSDSQRERHRLLTEKLGSAMVGRTELPDGYALVLDLKRLPPDAAGEPFCVVEVAEWMDLEARCCPFVDFAVEMKGSGGPMRLRLTGGEGVKEFLKAEWPLARAAAR